MPMLYKVLWPDGRCYHGGIIVWPLPEGEEPGEWVPTLNGALVPCISAYHFTDSAHLPKWLGPAIFEAEADSPVLWNDQYIARRGRLLRRMHYDRNTSLCLAIDYLRRGLDVLDLGRSRPKEIRNSMSLVLEAAEQLRDGHLTLAEARAFLLTRKVPDNGWFCHGWNFLMSAPEGMGGSASNAVRGMLAWRNDPDAVAKEHREQTALLLAYLNDERQSRGPWPSDGMTNKATNQ